MYKIFLSDFLIVKIGSYLIFGIILHKLVTGIILSLPSTLVSCQLQEVISFMNSEPVVRSYVDTNRRQCPKYDLAKAKRSRTQRRDTSCQFLTNPGTIRRHYPYLWPPILESSSMFD
jgi:hypothetical protein